MPAALDACLHWGCALPLPAGEGGQWGWPLFFNSLCTQQQDRAPLAAPAAGAALSQAAQNRLLLLSGMKLQTQPGLMYPSCSSSGSIWLSDGVLLDVASLLPLLTGWKLSELLLPRLLAGSPSGSPSSARSRPEQYT